MPLTGKTGELEGTRLGLTSHNGGAHYANP